MKRNSFTLMELLVVVAVIALLSAMLTPALMKAWSKSYLRTCANNLRQIGQALSLYAADSYQDFPDEGSRMYGSAGDKRIYPDYIDNAQTFFCPTDSGTITTINNSTDNSNNSCAISYAFAYGLALRHKVSDPVASDNGCGSGKNHEEGGNVLFLDGHVEWILSSKWNNSTQATPGNALNSSIPSPLGANW